jgi:hypothetical protein
MPDQHGNGRAANALVGRPGQRRNPEGVNSVATEHGVQGGHANFERLIIQVHEAPFEKVVVTEFLEGAEPAYSWFSVNHTRRERLPGRNPSRRMCLARRLVVPW